jgi:hypothetical protein
MLLGVDHLVIAVDEPDRAVAQVAHAIGVRPGGGGRHDRLGTFNRLIWVGDSYIEFVGIFDRELAATSWLGAPTLRALDRGGFVTWAIATDDIERDVARLRGSGADLTDAKVGERVRPDGDVVRWSYAVPFRLGPDLPPFLIEHDRTAAEWRPADRADRAAQPGRLRGIDIGVADVEAAGARLAEEFALEPRRMAGVARFAIGDQTVTLRTHHGGPAATVRLSNAEVGPTKIGLFGCQWIVETAAPDGRAAPG